MCHMQAQATNKSRPRDLKAEAEVRGMGLFLVNELQVSHMYKPSNDADGNSLAVRVLYSMWRVGSLSQLNVNLSHCQLEIAKR